MHSVIIYDATETAFTGNGLGGLCPSECKVTEEINGDFSLTMSHPQDENEKYAKLAVGRVIKIWTYRGYQLFRIYKIDKPIFGTIPVYARHIFYDLLDNFILDTRPSAASAATAGQAILAGCTEATDFTFASDITGIATAYYVRTNPVAAFIGTDDQSMINRWGGEIERDNFAVKINSQIGANNGVIIAYRKNLTGLTMTEDISGAYSDICPTAVSKDGGVLKLPETYVSSTTSTLPRKRYTTTHFDDIKVGAADTGGVVQYATDGDAYTEMRARCNALFAAGLDRPAVTLAVQFASLAGVDGYDKFAALNTVDLGDTVTVKHEPLNVDLALRVISVVWDVLSERYDDLTIGDKKPNLGQTVSGIDTSVANLDQQMSGTLMQGEEYNNVYINHEDGFVCETTINSQTVRVAMNATDGLKFLIDGVDAGGIGLVNDQVALYASMLKAQGATPYVSLENDEADPYFGAGMKFYAPYTVAGVTTMWDVLELRNNWVNSEIKKLPRETSDTAILLISAGPDDSSGASVQLAQLNSTFFVASLQAKTGTVDNSVDVDQEKIQMKLSDIYKVTLDSSGFKIDDKFGCNGSTPQAAYASGGAVSGTADTTYSSNEVTLINALKTRVNNIRTALINCGIMS